MDGGKRRRFVPGGNGRFELEGRLVLNAAGMTLAQAVVAQQVAPPNGASLKGTTIQAALNQVHAAYQGFIAKYNRACQNAIRGLAAGRNEAELLSALKASTTLDGGVLETQLNTASKRIPGAVAFLYNPQANPPTSTDKRDRYVPADQRLKTQADVMLATLTGTNPKTLPVTTIQAACSPAANTLIFNTYQLSRAAMAQYVRTSVANGDFKVSGWNI